MKQVFSVRYLGDFLCSTLEESVHMTVMKRVGVAKKSIYDIRAIIEDKRAECLGGFNLALEIWSASVEPMLWTNAESWVNVQKKTMRVLDDLYSTLYRSLFRIGTGCPRVNYYWQLATLLPANILLLKQLFFCLSSIQPSKRFNWSTGS